VDGCTVKGVAREGICRQEEFGGVVVSW
jgi:hypothetical protein